MIILFDLDGTVVDFITPAIKRVKEIWGITIKEEEIVNPRFGELVIRRLNEIHPKAGESLREEDIYMAIIESPSHYAKDNFFYKLLPYKNSIKTIKKIAKDHKVIFLTKLSPPFAIALDGKARWLKKYMKDIHYKTIYVEETKAKKYIVGDIIVDDDPRVLEDYLRLRADERVPVCIEQPWNKKFRQSHPNIKSIKSLIELPRIIKEL